MFDRINNLFRLVQIFRERGNWPLIRRSKKQLRNFIFGRNDLNRMSILKVPFYWFDLLKGLEVLVWRLETFGFLYLPNVSEENKKNLNRFL